MENLTSYHFLSIRCQHVSAGYNYLITQHNKYMLPVTPIEWGGDVAKAKLAWPVFLVQVKTGPRQLAR